MKTKINKSHYILFFSILSIFVFLLILWNWDFSKKDQAIIWGATFSKLQAEELGLDWVQVYGTMIDEKKYAVLIKNIKTKNNKIKYDLKFIDQKVFKGTDYYLNNYEFNCNLIKYKKNIKSF